MRHKDEEEEEEEEGCRSKFCLLEVSQLSQHVWAGLVGADRVLVSELQH